MVLPASTNILPDALYHLLPVASEADRAGVMHQSPPNHSPGGRAICESVSFSGSFCGPDCRRVRPFVTFAPALRGARDITLPPLT